MKKTINFNSAKTTKGFTLLEVLLSVMLFGAIMLGVFQILNDVAKKEVARSTAKYMEAVTEAVEKTINSDLVVFDAFYDDLLATAALCGAPNWVCAKEYDLTNATAVFDFVNGGVVSGVPVAASSSLNANFRGTNPLRSPMTVILSIADDASITTDTRALHIFVIANTRAPNDMVRNSASEAGPNGGFYETAGGPLVSAYNSWRFNVADTLGGTAWIASAAAAAAPNPPNPDDGTYLLHYAYVNYQDTSGDYLYRQQQPDPQLHVMLSNLNLGGNNILGADNVIVGEDITVENQVIVQGSAYIRGDMTVRGSLYSDGVATARNLTLDHEGGALTDRLDNASFLGSDGNPDSNKILSLGDISVGRLNMNAGGELSADVANLRNVNVQDLDATYQSTNADPANNDPAVDVFGNVNMGGASANITTIGISGSTDTTVNGNVNATAIDFANSDLTVNGNMGMLQMNSDANVTVGGQFTVPVYSANNLNVNTFGLCDDGCGE